MKQQILEGTFFSLMQTEITGMGNRLGGIILLIFEYTLKSPLTPFLK